MKKHKKKKSANSKSISFKALFAVLGGIVALLFLGYIAFVIYFQSHFLFHTTINQIAVSNENVEQVQSKLEKKADSYLLTIFDRNQSKYHIKASDIAYKYQKGDGVKKLLNKQNAAAWIGSLFHKNNLTTDSTYSFDESKLSSTVSALPIFDAANIVEPQDAVLTKTGSGYEITPETKGSHPILDQVLSQVKAAVRTGETSVTLTDAAYVAPLVDSTDATLNACLDKINAYLNTSVTYDIEGQNEVLDKNTIVNWITIDKDYNVGIDSKQVAKYVQSLASKYNTYGDVRAFKTTKGDTLSFGGGDYGWVVDKTKEAAEIMTDLQNATAVKREPIYSQRALYRTADDIGNTYVEIDYTNQHLWYYQDGALIADCDIVSGKIVNGNGSPDGFYKIVYKQSPATLVGEDYQSDVTYFMPFAYNIGLHDASWRNAFGGSIYINQGSHGCVNCPYDVVQKIYQNIKVGTPVVAYYRNPVTLTSNADRISNAYSYVAPDKTDGTATAPTNTTTNTTTTAQ